MEFLFDKDKHVYTLNGEKLESVTTILRVLNKPALIQWAANCVVDYMKEWIHRPVEDCVPIEEALEIARTAHAKKKTDAGQVGTDIHAEIEGYVKHCIDEHGGQNCLESEYATETPQTAKFIEWSNENDVRFLASELRLYSQKHKFAGTADFICEIKGQTFVGDIKTSSNIYPEHFIQASAYAEALKEMGLYKKFKGVIIVNLPKKGGILVEINSSIKKNFEAFKACLTLHKHLNL